MRLLDCKMCSEEKRFLTFVLLYQISRRARLYLAGAPLCILELADRISWLANCWMEATFPSHLFITDRLLGSPRLWKRVQPPLSPLHSRFL